MNIKTFTQEEEANTFADGVKVSKFELQGDKYVITYAPFYTEEQLIESRLKNDEEEAIIGLQQAEMQLKYLQAKEHPSEEEKAGLKTLKANKEFYKLKLRVVREQKGVV